MSAEEFEFVIVGAGSSGATLAARLADAGRTVLLLEAGPDYRSAQTPAAMRQPNPNPVINEPQYARYRWDDLRASRTAEQRAYTYWRGRGTGGSSAINGQIAIRGVPQDYDAWAATGCDGWGWPGVLPYFNRLETDLRYPDADWHGDTGPIPIYRAPLSAWGPVDLALGEAALDEGYPWQPDHNAPDAIGVSPYAINSRDSERVSVNDGYLEPRRHLNHLVVQGDVLVDKVLFDGHRAVAVQARVGDAVTVFRGERIVISAGAVHSPGLLLRSGIGPAEHLAQMHITVRTDLPVGEGFQDHPVINVLLPVQEAVAVPAEFRHTNCCVRYSSSLHGAHAGDMMMVAMNRLGDSIGAALGRSSKVTTAGLLGVWVNQCESRGSVRLASADALAQPVVSANMLSAESDRRRLFDGWRRLRAILESDSVRAVAAGYRLDASGTGIGDLDDYTAFVPWALANAADTQHASCTCRMGNPDDSTTVVDSQCRVLGTDNLFVVDASVMPSVPCANTNLTAIMIGEKMADLLLTG